MGGRVLGTLDKSVRFILLCDDNMAVGFKIFREQEKIINLLILLNL